MWRNLSTHFVYAADSLDLQSLSCRNIVGVVCTPGSCCSYCSAPGIIRVVVEWYHDCYRLACDYCAGIHWLTDTSTWTWHVESHEGLIPVLEPKYIDLLHMNQVSLAQALGWVAYVEQNGEAVDLLLTLASEGRWSPMHVNAAQQLILDRGGEFASRRRRDGHYRIERLQRLSGLPLSEARRLNKLWMHNRYRTHDPLGLSVTEIDQLARLERRYKYMLTKLDEQEILSLVVGSAGQANP